MRASTGAALDDEGAAVRHGFDFGSAGDARALWVVEHLEQLRWCVNRGPELGGVAAVAVDAVGNGCVVGV